MDEELLEHGLQMAAAKDPTLVSCINRPLRRFLAPARFPPVAPEGVDTRPADWLGAFSPRPPLAPADVPDDLEGRYWLVVETFESVGMAIVQVVHVVTVLDCDVTAARAVLVFLVLFVRVVCSLHQLSHSVVLRSGLLSGSSAALAAPLAYYGTAYRMPSRPAWRVGTSLGCEHAKGSDPLVA